MNKDTLVFSIALNGYQWRYKKHLKSHQDYAQRYNYHYQAVTRPFVCALGIECCWLKLTLMQSALQAGYKFVLFVDADAYVQESCPPIDEVLVQEKCLYMAKGYSNRFNSGVLLVRNCYDSRQWINKVINSRAKPVADENNVGWGENSHIIELSEGCHFIKELSIQWNNTYQPTLKDFIRHQNSGPLRVNYWDNLFHKVIFYVSQRLVQLTPHTAPTKHAPPTDKQLNRETARMLQLYPAFYKRSNTTQAHKLVIDLNSTNRKT